MAVLNKKAVKERMAGLQKARQQTLAALEQANKKVEQLKAQISAFNGAIGEAQFWLKVYDEQEAADVAARASADACDQSDQVNGHPAGPDKLLDELPPTAQRN